MIEETVSSIYVKHKRRLENNGQTDDSGQLHSLSNALHLHKNVEILLHGSEKM
jgi:hypothetical protein